MAINVGIIGHGYAAQTFHLPLLAALPDFNVCALYSSQAGVALAGAAVYRDLQAFLAHPGLTLVIVTAPNDVHFSLGQQVLQAGLHLVIEKPMAISLEQAQALSHLAQQQQRLLTVFHNRRWDGDFLTVKRLLAERRLGAVKYFESRFDRFRPVVRDRWRENAGPGAGIWYDLGPHLLDQTLQLFGWPASITARLLALREGAQNTDYFHVQLHYSDCEAVLHASPFCATEVLRFRVEGSQGSYTQFGLDPQENQLKSGLAADHAAFGQHGQDATAARGLLCTGAAQEHIRTERGDYLAFYRQLAGALRGAGPTPVAPQEAIAVMALLALAEQSHAQGARIACADNIWTQNN